MLISEKACIAKHSRAAQQVSARASRTMPTLPCSGTSTRISATPQSASEIFRDAIRRNPDNDQYYLSLALVQLARQRCRWRGGRRCSRVWRAFPSSGKILWGLGIVSVLEGKTPQAEQRLERAVDLLPEWPGSYSTLGIFYYQTGEIDKAREVLNRFKGSNANGGLDVNRIEEALSQRRPKDRLRLAEPMPMVARQQLLQLALSLADRTL